MSVQLAPAWERQHPVWRFVGNRAREGRLVHRRVDAKHFPDHIEAFRYVEFLFVDNPHVQAWRIQTLDGRTVEHAAREAWENELA